MRSAVPAPRERAVDGFLRHDALDTQGRAPEGPRVRRALAAALAIALFSALAHAAPAVTAGDETSVRAAEHPGIPGEPPGDSPAKLSAIELFTIEAFVPSAAPSGLVYERAARVGRGELHARLPERPPRPVSLHS
jgi:hypothetical protein